MTMSITIQSNTDTVLERPGLAGTLGPGKTVTVPAMTEDLVRAVDLGLLLVPSGAEPPPGLPPVLFEHRYPHVLPLSADRAYYVRVLRAPGGFHDGTRLRDFVAYYGDGDGMSCAFSDDGLAWDNEKKVSGIAESGYHVVCALEAPDRLRILYWDPDVPDQPYNIAGLRTAVCNPKTIAAAFTEDAACTGNLVTGGGDPAWNRGHYGPSFLWYNPEPTSIPGRPFTWRYALLFIATTGGALRLGSGLPRRRAGRRARVAAAPAGAHDHARVQARESHGVLQGVVHLHRPGKTGEDVIAVFELGIADYLRDRAVFMEATTIERISFPSFFRSTKRFSSINPASEISSIQ